MWEYIPFENCLEKTKIRFKLPKKDYRKSGEYPIVSQEDSLISGYHDDISYVFKISKPIVVFGDHTLALKYIDFDFIVGADGVKILQPVEGINAKYFYYVLKALIPKSTGYARHYKLLKKLDIPVPPLPEQERIVAKLDAVFAEIDEAVNAVESKESEVQALKTSILNKLLNNKSNGWESSCLEGVSSFISRGISPKYIESGGVRVLNQKCIRNHHINYDLARRHDMDLKKVSEERFIRLGDILINSTGKGTLGRVAQVRKEPDELTTIDSHITIVRPKSELFYLDYFGYAALAIEKIIQDAGQGASGQTELAKSKVQNDFQICFPRSFSEQEVEVKKLDIVFEETEIALINLIKSKTNLYALKSVILSVELKPNEAA